MGYLNMTINSNRQTEHKQSDLVHNVKNMLPSGITNYSKSKLTDGDDWNVEYYVPVRSALCERSAGSKFDGYRPVRGSDLLGLKYVGDFTRILRNLRADFTTFGCVG